MAKYYAKLNTIQAITFDELIEYGLKHSTSVIDGMPWSFEYNGCAITNEHMSCYLICSPYAVMKFTPDDMLITDVNMLVYTMPKYAFDSRYGEL